MIILRRVSSFKDGHCHAGTQSFDKHGKGSNLLGMGKQSQQAKKAFVYKYHYYILVGQAAFFRRNDYFPI